MARSNLRPGWLRARSTSKPDCTACQAHLVACVGSEVVLPLVIQMDTSRLARGLPTFPNLLDLTGLRHDSTIALGPARYKAL